ncbi:MAG: alpha/beta hydrolase [Myxococcota bacterium]
MPRAPRLSRRSFFGLGVCPAFPNAFLREPSIEERVIDVPGSPRDLGRSLVVLPIHRLEGEKLPVLVLLHGLGETVNPKLGTRAWVDAYGLGSAWARLSEGKLNHHDKYAYVSDEERWAIQNSLRERPFRGVCAVCPFLPNPYLGGNWQRSLERYAGWLTGKLLPAVRTELGSIADVERAGLAGVSLGGFSAVEVGLLQPTAFRALGTLQGAFSKVYAVAAARRLLKQNQRPVVYASTSSFDPYRAANLEFSRALESGGANVSFVERKGPHSQGWLREIGTLDALMWFDRALR